MIKFFQRHKTIRNIIYATVVITFVGSGFIGVALNTNQQNIVKESFGHEITKSELDKTINFILIKQFPFLNNQRSFSVLNKIKSEHYEALKKQALNLLDNKFKIIKYGKEKLGLIVSDTEVLKELSSNKMFQLDNQFNKNKYFQYLKYQRITVRDFEDKIREDILFDKTLFFLKKGLKTNFDTKAIVGISNISKEILINIIDTSKIKNFPILKKEDSELLAYYNLHKNTYKEKDFIEVLQFIFKKKKNEDIKEFKKRILKEKIQLSKGNNEKQFVKIRIYIGNPIYSKLLEYNPNQFSKPIFNENEAKIFKIISKKTNIYSEFKKIKKDILRELSKKSFIEDLKEKEKTKNISIGKFYGGYISNNNKIPDIISKNIKEKDISKQVYTILNNSFNEENIFIFSHYIVHYKIIDIVPEDNLKKDFSDIVFDYKIYKYIK